MSKLFYDHLIVLTEVEAEIKASVETEEERHELWQIVDEIVHHRVMEFILDKLEENYHDEFLGMFHRRPYHEGIVGYLKEKIEEDIENEIAKEIELLEMEILHHLKEEV